MENPIENTWMTTRGSPMVPWSYGDDIINKEILNWFSFYIHLVMTFTVCHGKYGKLRDY